MIPVQYCFILSVILFTIGIAGLLIRRNILLVLLSVELMLNAANLNLVAASTLHGSVDSQIMAFFVMVIAAAEVSIGLAIVVALFRKQDTVDTKDMTWLKG